MTNAQASRPEDIFPSLATGTGWQAANKPSAPAHIPSLNRAELSWLAGVPSVQIDREKLVPDFKRSGEVMSEQDRLARHKGIVKQITSNGMVPPDVAFNVAGALALNNQPATMYVLAPASEFAGRNFVKKPDSNHPFMQMSPPRGRQFRPLYLVHQPFSPAMSLKERVAEVSILESAHIERLPASQDVDSLYQLEGVVRAHSHRADQKNEASRFTQEIGVQNDTRRAYLNVAGGPQSAWDAHAATQVVCAFLTGDKMHQSIFPVLDPKISKNHESVEASLAELRLRSLAHVQGDDFPWTSREFNEVYQKGGKNPDQSPTFILTDVRHSGRLLVSLWEQEEHFSNFMFTGSTERPSSAGQFTETRFALPLVRAASEVMKQRTLDPDSQTARIAAVVRAAGTAFAPKAMQRV